MPHRRSKQGLKKQHDQKSDYFNCNFHRLNLLAHPNKQFLTFIASTPQEKKYHDGLRRSLVLAVRSCFICDYSNVNALEVHHIDGRHSNNAWTNIAVVCANCHTLITKGKLNYWEEHNRKNLKTSCEKKSMSDSKQSCDSNNLQEITCLPTVK